MEVFLEKGKEYKTITPWGEVSLEFRAKIGGGFRFRIVGKSNQLIFMPVKCVFITKEGYINRMDWFWNKYDSRHKLDLAEVFEQKLSW